MAGLQVTVQAPNCLAARWLHDQLMALSPIFIALTASAPVKRGLLSAYDSRWEIMSKTLDDRAVEEEQAGISRSRCTTLPLYIAKDCQTEILNDVPVSLDISVFDTLQAGGMDKQMAQSYGLLFERDPLLAGEDVVKDALEGNSSGRACFEVSVG